MRAVVDVLVQALVKPAGTVGPVAKALRVDRWRLIDRSSCPQRRRS